MPRRVPASTKQRKAQLQEKRALKRSDDLSALPLSKASSNKPKTHLSRSLYQNPLLQANQAASRRLQSRFIKLSEGFLENEKRRGEDEILVRPVEGNSARWESVLRFIDSHQADPTLEAHRKELLAMSQRLSIPRRPKWKRKPGTEAMTKKEVERNEEGVFEKWRREVEGIMIEWEEVETALSDSLLPHDENENPTAGSSSRPITRNEDDGGRQGRNTHIPSFYESNLEVYRQLWRVIERSDIVLVLADVRIPGVHLGEGMRNFLREAVYGKEEGKRKSGGGGSTNDTGKGDGIAQATRRKMGNKRVIVVLTKTDLVEEACRDGWVRWAKRWWKYGDEGSAGMDEVEDAEEEEDVDVVCVENYERFQLAQAPRHQQKHIPHIPPSSLSSLINALERAHSSLLDNEQKTMEPKIKKNVDWSRLLRGDDDGKADHKENEFVTIGLVGQPNVGKSSLLNALLGKAKVRASKTPGKTKHFQTIFWSDEIQIVDCPGLVIPSLTGFDMQVMAGVLPISQIPSLPTCILHVARLMPLEQILRLPEPKKWLEDKEARKALEGKKTYRSAAPKEELEEVEEVKWTAYLIMEGWALERGYLTAKAGRPDVNRAGNQIMRMVAEGRIPWAFWAPHTSDEQLAHADGKGVWTGGVLQEQLAVKDHTDAGEQSDMVDEDELTEESEADEEDKHIHGTTTAFDEQHELHHETEDEVSEEEEVRPPHTNSRFAALGIDDLVDEDSDDEDGK